MPGHHVGPCRLWKELQDFILGYGNHWKILRMDCYDVLYTLKGLLGKYMENMSEIGLPWYLSWQRIRLQCRRPWFDSWVGKICWRRDGLPTPVSWPGEFNELCSLWGRKAPDMTVWLLLRASQVALVVKNLPTMQETRDAGSLPGLGRSPGLGNGNPLQHSCLGNAMNRGAWRATVHGAIKSWTQVSN